MPRRSMFCLSLRLSSVSLRRCVHSISENERKDAEDAEPMPREKEKKLLSSWRSWRLGVHAFPPAFRHKYNRRTRFLRVFLRALRGFVVRSLAGYRAAAAMARKLSA